MALQRPDSLKEKVRLHLFHFLKLCLHFSLVMQYFVESRYMHILIKFTPYKILTSRTSRIPRVSYCALAIYRKTAAEPIKVSFGGSSFSFII